LVLTFLLQVETDFLMAILNRLRSEKPHLKLILMSATVHSQLILSYFSPCALVQVPGRMFHVSELYLEDINALVRTGQLIQSGMVQSHPRIIAEEPGAEDGEASSLPETRRNFHRVGEDQIAEFVIRLIQRENALKRAGGCEDGAAAWSSFPFFTFISRSRGSGSYFLAWNSVDRKVEQDLALASGAEFVECHGGCRLVRSF
jgi:hypothetical protein